MSDGEYEDYLYELGWLTHTPMPPHPRPKHSGEEVYAEEWSKLMQEKPEHGYHAPNSMLANILDDLPAKLTQRHATICATVVCWFGTSVGQSIILHAKRYREQDSHTARAAYLVAWTLENQRVPYVNHGFRMLEHLLGQPEDYGVPMLGIGLRQLVRRPTLSVEDYETVEHLMSWLGDKGTGFILRCEKRIEERNEWERVKRYEAMKARQDKLE